MGRMGVERQNSQGEKRRGSRVYWAIIPTRGGYKSDRAEHFGSHLRPIGLINFFLNPKQTRGVRTGAERPMGR